eukprot:CAMPEP_0115032658 /NCGR_PEP_ID=MMETSP0216-20121206/39294_1 /TAXON_ID=223996 /ORGANISM="Protocruzia adherens, Strain Boccale" /LENGTH=72 /DNA_ID=CAMNT_0002410609 /DNA_START=487 /DNA_END=702 /DNA_ORIENTATION=+
MAPGMGGQGMMNNQYRNIPQLNQGQVYRDPNQVYQGQGYHYADQIKGMIVWFEPHRGILFLEIVHSHFIIVL